MSQNPDNLLQTLRALVREELARVQAARLGLVTETQPHADEGDGDNYSCTVELRDAGLVLERVPVATARTGLAAIPAVGDLVLLQFINGDINRPVITGSLYNDEDRPPPNADNQWVGRLPAAAGEGEGVQLVANGAGTAALTLTVGGSLILKLADDDPVVSVDVGGGSTVLTIDSDGALKVQGGRGIEVEAGSDLKLKGANVSIEGSGEVNIKGAVINLN